MGNYDKEAFKLFLLLSMGTRGVNQFASQAGVSSSYISELINLKRSSPPSMNIINNLSRVAYNHVGRDDFMRAAGYIDTSVEEDELDDLLDDLIEEDQINNKASEQLALDEKSTCPKDLAYIPFLIDIGSSDKSIFNNNNIHEYCYENIKDVRYGTFFAYSAPDNSMDKSKINKGDILTIKYQDRLENNKIFLILLHKKLTLRRIFLKEYNIIFAADNGKIQPEIFNIDTINKDVVDVIGKVTYVKIKL